MSLQVENLEHNMAKVTIEVEAAKLDNAIKQAFNKKKDSLMYLDSVKEKYLPVDRKRIRS